jgi:hypothetical protein
MQTPLRVDDTDLGARINRLLGCYEAGSLENHFLQFLKNRWDQGGLTPRDQDAVNLIANRADRQS